MYGPTAIKDSVIPVEGLGTSVRGMQAPTIIAVGTYPEGFQVVVRLPRHSSTIGARLVWIERKSKTDHPFSGLSMKQCMSLQGSVTVGLGGPPGSLRIFESEWFGDFKPGDLVEFVCAGTDDPDDIETP